MSFFPCFLRFLVWSFLILLSLLWGFDYFFLGYYLLKHRELEVLFLENSTMKTSPKDLATSSRSSANGVKHHQKLSCFHCGFKFTFICSHHRGNEHLDMFFIRKNMSSKTCLVVLICIFKFSIFVRCCLIIV